MIVLSEVFLVYKYDRENKRPLFHVSEQEEEGKKTTPSNGLVFTYIFEESIQPKQSRADFLLLTNQ